MPVFVFHLYIMKQSTFFVLFYLFTSCGQAQNAQTDSFHLLSYKAPAGFSVEKNEQVVGFVAEDKQSGAFCNIIIYRLMNGKGNATADFSHAWENLLMKPFAVNASPEMQPAGRIKGWELMNGNAQYTVNGVNAMAMLFTFSGNNQLQTIVIMFNSQQYKKQVEDFIAGIEVVKENAQAVVAPQSPAVASSGMAGAEVWMVNRYIMNLKRYGTQWFVIYPGNQYLYYMPETGLLGVTKGSSELANGWGVVSDKGVELHLKNDFLGTVMKLGKISATEMSYPPGSKTSIYRKCRSVDGLLLEGEYSPDHPNWYKNLQVNKDGYTQVIAFKKDGTFYNKGLVALYDMKTANMHREFGAGTYMVRDYTLVLSYKDGTVCRVALNGINNVDPHQNSELLYIRLLPYYKNPLKK